MKPTMAREAFESLPLWKAAMRLALDAHRVANEFPADEKSSLGGTLKKLADAPATLAAHADAAEAPDEALTQLGKCEATFRELLATALLAHQLDLLNRTQLRRLRLHVARLRVLVDDETQAWEAAREPQRREQEERLQHAAPALADHDFDPRDQRSIQRELDLDDVDAIGLSANHPPALRFTDAPTRPVRKPGSLIARIFGGRRAA